MNSEKSETVSTPTLTPVLEPSLSPPSQHPPPGPSPISSLVHHSARPPHPPHRGGRAPRDLGVDAEAVNEVVIYDVSKPSKGKKQTWVWHEYELEGEGTGDEKACCMHCK